MTSPDGRAPRGPVGLFDEIGAGGVREAVDDDAWLAALLDVEAALAVSTADAGGLDPAAAVAIAAACRPERFDVARLAVDAASAGNPVVPLVAALRRSCAPTRGTVPLPPCTAVRPARTWWTRRVSSRPGAPSR